ncbi:MAG: hypothetical protein ACOY90_21815 [Candidatus Zhuqueibacterota bacterium]
MKRMVFLFFLLIFNTSLFSQSVDNDITGYLTLTLDDALKSRDAKIDDWKKRYTSPQDKDSENMMQLLGYQPPDFLVGIASISAYLYERTGEKKYASITRDVIVSLEAYRDFFPARFKDRVEYRDGVPVVNWFRTLPNFIECYQRTKNSGLYSTGDIEKIKESVAASVDIIFMFPEWGAMNRAMLRAESFMASAVAFPDHPHAKKWLKMAEILAGDSIGKWEIEDAQIYHPVWLRSYINYLDLSGRTDRFQSPVMKFYFDYFVSLMAPNRTIPEFGDGRYMDWLHEYYLCLERGAKEYQSGEMKWAADEMFGNLSGTTSRSLFYPPGTTAFDTPNVGFANTLIVRERYRDPNVLPVEPHYTSGDALEEIIGKKIVFRSDWTRDASYLLLNYKDEGYFSVMQKNYLKHVLAVEEEKMHHGHSDENAICLFMKDGSVLLSDGNYREVAPSGEFGAFRADIFHNRIVVRDVKKYLTQPYFDIFRNSGAYNDQVRTTKIDFQIFNEIEYSRTRLEDMKLGYRWDRVLARHSSENYFVMVDALKFFKSDYFTIGNLLHTRKIIDRGDTWFLTRIDQLSGQYPNPGNLNLLIIFPQDKFTGAEPERRDKQDELALFQGTSQYYDAGAVESFVTILYPLEPGRDPREVVARFALIKDDEDGLAVQVRTGFGTNLYGVKLDLDRDLLKQDIRPRYHYNSGKIAYGKAETDADMFFVNAMKDKTYFSATNLVKFVYDTAVLFDTPESQFFQVWGKSDRTGRAKWRSWDNYESNIHIQNGRLQLR